MHVSMSEHAKQAVSFWVPIVGLFLVVIVHAIGTAWWASDTTRRVLILETQQTRNMDNITSINNKATALETLLGRMDERIAGQGSLLSKMDTTLERLYQQGRTHQ